MTRKQSQKSHGHRHLGFRVWAMAGLFLLPICIFARLFIAESNKSIDFAAKETAGIEYLRSVWPVFVEIGAKPWTSLDAGQLALLTEARDLFDPQFGTARFSADAVRLLPYKGTSQAPKLEGLRHLIDEIGDRSNLILDPQLDTYYLVESMLIRLPEVVEAVSLLAAMKQTHDGSANSATELYSAAFRSLGRLQSVIEDTAAFHKTVALAGSTGRRASELSAATIGFAPVATRFHRSADLMVRRLAVRSLTGGGTDTAVALPHEALLAATDRLWRASADELVRRLEARKAAFQQELWLALAVSTLIVLLALCLAVLIFRKVMASFDERTVYLARHDAMTSLLNRATFIERLEETLARAVLTDRLALHYLDIDRFKQINDTLGHDIGDGLIKAVAGRIAREVRSGDLVARLGGDEFVLAQVSSATSDAAQSLTARLNTILAEPYSIGGHEIRVSASIGTAFYPEDGGDVVHLMKAADLALYQAKADGRNAARVFKPAMHDAIQQRRRIEVALHDAVSSDAFDLQFQPIMAADPERLHGFEALLRMQDPDGAALPPSVFIPIAEEMGLIAQIDAWTLRHACKFATVWPEGLCLAVNLSPLRFESGDLAQTLAAILAETGLAAERLEIEVTERLLLNNSPHVVEQFAKIRSLGVRIQMDDFGAGHSSLSYLWQFPFDGIKIDRLFLVSLAANDSTRKRLLSSFVAMGHSLGISVTAEGIETEEQVQIARDIACDRLQGYHFARPMPSQDVAAYILRDSRLPLIAHDAVQAPLSMHLRFQQLRQRLAGG